MLTVKMRAVIVAIGVTAAALGAATPASADPADSPCELVVAFICRFLPIAPDLDHDIDLTQDPAVIDGQQLPELPVGGQYPEHEPWDAFS